MRRKLTPHRRKYYLKAWRNATLWTLLIILLGALFAVRFFFIRGGSMKDTLMSGDFVYLDKLSYGARIPMHPISLPYSKTHYLESVELPYMRMPGLRGVKRGDVIAFDHPMGPMDVPKDKRDVLMKRCVGLPGDSLTIRGARLQVNGEIQERAEGVVVHYHLKVRNDSLAAPVLEEYGVERAIGLSNQGDRVVPLTMEEAETLRSDPRVSFVEAWQGGDVKKSDFFPGHPDHPWRPGRVGPLWIPKEGMEVALDTSALPLYRRIIEVYEGHELEVVEDTLIRIDGEAAESYTFEMDYFYVLGDSRPYSRDSRVWGFLPEDHITGRALFILFSYDPKEGGEGFRWDRSLSWVR